MICNVFKQKDAINFHIMKPGDMELLLETMSAPVDGFHHDALRLIGFGQLFALCSAFLSKLSFTLF